MPKTTPEYPLYLVIPGAGSRLATLSDRLAPVRMVADNAKPTGVDLYYRSGTDMALLALRCDARLTTAVLIEDISAALAGAGGALLDTARLPDDARRRFYADYLPLYDISVARLHSLDAALQALASQLQARSSPTPLPPPAGRLEIRFLRGDRWHLGRVRSITSDGISVATAAPPRQGDGVDIELSSGGYSLIVRSMVVGVTSPEAATAIGAMGFGARFIMAHPDESRRIHNLIVKAGGERLRTLRPPPRRREARYEVNWPVFLESSGKKTSLRALDLSRHGMFVAQIGGALRGSLEVDLPLDDHRAPIRAEARVARAIDADLARTRGIAAGVGLELIGLSEPDQARFFQFVARVARRAEHDVLVAAGPERLAELISALRAAGYEARGVSDAPTLVSRAATFARTPDLVILDTSLAPQEPRVLTAARRALGKRMVRTVVIDDDPPRQARERVDGALLG